MPGRYIPPHLRNKNKTHEVKKPVAIRTPVPEPKTTADQEVIETCYGVLKVVNVDPTSPLSGELKFLEDNERFARAYLNSKRRLKKAKNGSDCAIAELVDIYWLR